MLWKSKGKYFEKFMSKDKRNKKNQFIEGNKAAEKDMDFAMLDNLIGIFCTLEECSAVLGLDEDTVMKKVKEKYGVPFSVYFKQKNAFGKASLRRRQVKLSETNPALSIWLGKQYLGQRDENYLRPDGVKKIVIEYVDDIKTKGNECIPPELAGN